jgi:hypothetical protein
MSRFHCNRKLNHEEGKAKMIKEDPMAVSMERPTPIHAAQKTENS